MKQLIYAFILTSAFVLNANAEPRELIRPTNFDKKIPYSPEVLDLKGIVRSDGSHASDCNIDLELVVQDSGKIYSISDPGELAALHCTKEKNFSVTMKAERTPKFLFWGGNLKVQSFEIIEELEAQPHKKVPVVRRAPFTDRTNRI